MRTEAEFELWLAHFEQRIHEIVQRWTRRLAAMIVIYSAVLFAVLVIVMKS